MQSSFISLISLCKNTACCCTGMVSTIFCLFKIHEYLNCDALYIESFNKMLTKS